MSSPADIPLSEPTAVPYCRRILVIDDSALVREAAKIALGTIGGWEVLTAECGEQGIELADSWQPDAILLDVVMPGMDGITVAEQLQNLPSTSSVPVVLLTAKDPPDDERLRALALSGVIAKPFDVDGLRDELASLLGWAT